MRASCVVGVIMDWHACKILGIRSGVSTMEESRPRRSRVRARVRDGYPDV